MQFPDVWTNSDFIDIPEEEWMRIPMKDGWVDCLRKSSKRYPANSTTGLKRCLDTDQTFGFQAPAFYPDISAQGRRSHVRDYSLA
jgi:hypothetical protein